MLHLIHLRLRQTSQAEHLMHPYQPTSSTTYQTLSGVRLPPIIMRLAKPHLPLARKCGPSKSGIQIRKDEGSGYYFCT